MTVPGRSGCSRTYFVVTPTKNRSITNIVRNISFIACTTPKNVRLYYTGKAVKNQESTQRFEQRK